MVKIRQVDVTLLDKPKAAQPASRELTPKQRERLEQQRQFERMLSKVSDRDTVFEIRLDAADKALTVRQRLMKAAQATGKDIVVRKSDKGWLVGMATDDRRSRRGRRKASAAGSAKA
ncbi:MAG: hypothetical protein ABIP53_05520 [Candidatus Limnocylindrales bacterium]